MAATATQMTKMEAARIAMRPENLGKNATAQELADWCNRTYGVGLTKAVAQNYAGVVRRKLGKTKKGKAENGHTNLAERVGVPAIDFLPGETLSATQKVSIDDVRVIRWLCKRLGGDGIIQLVGIMDD